MKAPDQKYRVYIKSSHLKHLNNIIMDGVEMQTFHVHTLFLKLTMSLDSFEMKYIDFRFLYKGPSTNYVGKILPILTPPPPSAGKFTT